RLRQTGHVTRGNRVIRNVHGDIENGRFAVTEPLRPAQGDVEELLPLDHLTKCLASNGGLHDALHVVHAHAPEAALIAIDGKLQVRLSEDTKYADVLDALDSVQHVLDLIGQSFQFVQVRSNNFHGIVAFHAGQRFHDVIADVLREI